MKSFFFLFALVSSVFAQSMCEEYCGNCVSDPNGESCVRIARICGCDIGVRPASVETAADTSEAVNADALEQSGTMSAEETASPVETLEPQGDSVAVPLEEPAAEIAEPAQEPATEEPAAEIAEPAQEPATEEPVMEPVEPAENKIADSLPVANAATNEDASAIGFRLGIGADFRVVEPSYFGKIPYENYNLGYGVGWHFILQWEFGKILDLRTGANFGFIYADMNWSVDERDWKIVKSANIHYRTFYFEIPFAARLRIPVSEQFVPFASYAFLVKKPLYEWGDYEFYFSANYPDYEPKNGYLNGDDYENDFDGAFDVDDWEFAHNIGFGVEIMKQFSIEMSFVVSSFDAGSGGVHEYTDSMAHNFRINLDYLF